MTACKEVSGFQGRENNWDIYHAATWSES